MSVVRAVRHSAGVWPACPFYSYAGGAKTSLAPMRSTLRTAARWPAMYRSA